MSNEYNGWKNYETWSANLWLDESYHMVCELVEECVQEHDDKDEAIRILADNLKDFLESEIPDLGASFAADMLSAAMAEVDFYEIAERRIFQAWEEKQNV